MKLNNPARLVISIAVPNLAGLIGALFTFSAIPVWYATLTKPSFSPPNWIFGPAWTTLYVLMGIAAYLVWQKGLKDAAVRNALGIFLVQLILNTLWSVFFFGFRNPGIAFVEIVTLWLAIVATMTSFWPLSRRATWLLVPYILWVSFAAYLNYTIWILN